MSKIQDASNAARKLANKIGNINRTDDILDKLIDRFVDGNLIGEINTKIDTKNFNKNISDYKAKRVKKRSENHTDIFKSLLDVVNAFFKEDRPTNVDANTPFLTGRMLRNITTAAISM